MTHLFPSPGWIQAYQDALNASPAYREAASTWTAGAIAMVVEPAPEVSSELAGGFAVWLDLDQGHCQNARAVSVEEARKAPFCLTTRYDRWRAVIERRLDPIAAMITRRIALQGDLVTMIRYARSAQAMVLCATDVPSHFLEARGAA
jgi:putative sterol carrier protein